MVQIPDYNDIVNKEYIMLEDFEAKDTAGGTLPLAKGIKFKITSWLKNDVTIKVTSTVKECDAMIMDFAKVLRNREEVDMNNLQHSIDLWVNSPEKFIPDPKSLWNNNFGKGIEDYIRTDGKKCRYSYLATFEQFKDLKWFQTVYEENRLEFVKWSNPTKADKIYLHGILKDKRKMDVKDLNKAKFERI